MNLVKKSVVLIMSMILVVGFAGSAVSAQTVDKNYTGLTKEQINALDQGQTISLDKPSENDQRLKNYQRSMLLLKAPNLKLQMKTS